MNSANPVETTVRPIDFTVFGVLFLISAPMELWNIASTDWKYTPKFFGFITGGVFAKAILIAQPFLHIALGYGFLRQRRWAFYLALFYAADVLTSTVTGFILQGFGRIRTVFLALLTPFVIYVIWRRKAFDR